MSERLDNCKYCNSDDVRHCEGVGSNHYIKCMQCGIRTSSIFIGGKNNEWGRLTEIWNTRPTEMSEDELADIVFENHHGKTFGDCANAVAKAILKNHRVVSR